MGNTKNIWFEGYIAPESKNQFSKEELIDVCHGTYCAIEIDEEGYLGSNDQGERNLFVIGMVHSYSMRGLNLLGHLEKYLIEGTAGFIDYDWPDCRVYRFWPDQKKAEVVLVSPPANPAPLPEEKNVL